MKKTYFIKRLEVKNDDLEKANAKVDGTERWQHLQREKKRAASDMIRICTRLRQVRKSQGCFLFLCGRKEPSLFLLFFFFNFPRRQMEYLSGLIFRD